MSVARIQRVIHPCVIPAKAGIQEGAKGRLFLVIGALAIIFGVVIAIGIISRKKAEADLQQATAAAAIPTVNVVYPKPGAPDDEIILPGNTQAFTDAPIFARTNGYVKSWYVDIGARVKKGQLLAVIETPEVDQQLQQARADLKTAQANLGLAQITADRWEALWKTDSVSKQETDQYVSNFHAMKATVDANMSNVRRLEELQGFQKIYAPFDGVITARNTDIGALINSGQARRQARRSSTSRPSTPCGSLSRCRNSIRKRCVPVPRHL